MANIPSTVSQNTSSTEPSYFKQERPITYRNLNEVLKLANYKTIAQKKDSIQTLQLLVKDSIISAQKAIIDKYERNVIPNLRVQLASFKAQNTVQDELNAIRDEKWKIKYDRLKSKRIGIGAFVGYGLVITSGMPTIGASAGVSVHYSIFRF